MINGNTLIGLGVPVGKSIGSGLTLAYRLIAEHPNQQTNPQEATAHAIDTLAGILNNPAAHTTSEQPDIAAFAAHLTAAIPVSTPLRAEPAPFTIRGASLIQEKALEQMRNAMRLPGALRGALMPDAHMGYGLPIGGVMALEGGVNENSPTGLTGEISPFAIGVDISCSMHVTIFDVPADQHNHEVLKAALLKHTRFGTGSAFEPHDRWLISRSQETPLFDNPAWTENPYLKRNPQLRDTAFAQLGSSGGGNHFASFCTHVDETGVKRLALMTHSGSRGLGARIADHYSKLAMDLHPDLPGEIKHLAWLDLATEDGISYWELMHLAGDYATANHEAIHARISAELHATAHQRISNKHNYAWIEEITLPTGELSSAIVHRKGATPANKGQPGIIPGSMATPAYIVEGLGNPDSLNSASHGGGRAMSRTQAKAALRGRDLTADMLELGITLIGSGLDEAPEAYKPIEEVMRHQEDLVVIRGELHPKVVRMAGTETPHWQKPRNKKQ